MAFVKDGIRAVVFDYGNTLIEFGPAQIGACDRAIAGAVEKLYGPVDLERLRAIRDANRMGLYEGDPPAYRENDLHIITADMVRQLYGVEPARADVDEILRTRIEEFINIVRVQEEVRDLLGRLGQRYRLAMLSNYPTAEPIRKSLDKIGLAPFFELVVVSADLGYIKPHRLAFEAVTQGLGIDPSEILFVGDNWLADIQGAKRAGMWAALTTQWIPYEHFERHPGDHQPDFMIKDIVELERYL